MKGTEKQIAWAEDIRKDYEASIKDSIEYFEEVKEAGSFRKVDAPMLLADFVEMVKAYAEHDMMDSALYKAYHEAASSKQRRKEGGSPGIHGSSRRQMHRKSKRSKRKNSCS